MSSSKSKKIVADRGVEGAVGQVDVGQVQLEVGWPEQVGRGHVEPAPREPERQAALGREVQDLLAPHQLRAPPEVPRDYPVARDGAARRADHVLGHVGVAARVVQVRPAREAGLLPRDKPRVAAGAVAPRV